MREDSASEHATVGAVTLVSALAFGRIRLLVTSSLIYR